MLANRPFVYIFYSVYIFFYILRCHVFISFGQSANRSIYLVVKHMCTFCLFSILFSYFTNEFVI